MHDAAQFVDALDEKRMKGRIPDLLGEAARLVVKGVMHCPAGDGSNPFIEVDGETVRCAFRSPMRFSSDLLHTHTNED